ncbi:hypothetical protein CEUSTIGMA_g10764.t1 [Chlamydomonas eustigma]|uniref:DNA-directed RNA polymerase subunit beta n=1 Tax=Chlamydomonas eustigma TaxID=1157962 RepID=A0A250XK79_9CHLO|nr:hypothetical protein CEUSTIGMA_g10764.t1 [Chlamydomonas eustigma]|eukprot:GAX83339.1 hypothetical protein CEUSTIGMA_g10764.t1 [Chlamydomonas eustigma]
MAPSSDELCLILSLVSVHDKPWSVCKAWLSVFNNPDVMANILINSTSAPLLMLVKHGKSRESEHLILSTLDRLLEMPRFCLDKDVFKCCIEAISNGYEITLKRLLFLASNMLFDCEKALIFAAKKGNLNIVRLLLEKDASRADCQNGEALVTAAMNGHIEVVRLLLKWPKHAPKADCQDGRALAEAAWRGQLDVVRFLLEWPEHTPRADSQYGRVLMDATLNGCMDVIRLLLEWPEHAPRADCQDGRALVEAAFDGRLDVVRLLLEWPEHAPRADCQYGQALVYAAWFDHLELARLLLEWPEHAPRVDCRNGEALMYAMVAILAKIRNYSYTRNLIVDCDLKCTELDSGRVDEFRVPNIIVGAVPVMLRSKACILNGLTPRELRDAGECPFDMGGYFVIGGKEKVYISQETQVPNRAMIEKGNEKTWSHRLRLPSLTLYVKKGQVFASSLALSETVPVAILFAALGLVSDQQVCDAVGMIEPLRESLKLRSRTRESAIEFLATLVKFKTLSAAVVYIHDQFLPQVKGLDAKARLLSELVHRLLKVSMGQDDTLDRDSFLNKRMHTSGRFMTDRCSDLFQKFWFNARSMIDREWNLVHKHNYHFPFMSSFVTPLNVGLIFDLSIVQGGLERTFRNAEEIQDLSRISYASYLSHMRRTSAPKLGEGAKVLGPHKLNSAQSFILCPVDGPDGHNVGIVKTLAWTVCISGADGMSTEDAISRVTNLLETGKDLRVYVNEVPCATMFLGPLSMAMEKLKAKRESFGRFACFSRRDSSIIHVRTDEGRLLRPLRNLKSSELDMLDVEEVETECYIAMKDDGMAPFTHVEIHPACMLSVHASCIPFANHNQAARNVFSCSQGKQAIGLYATNFADRIDTAAYFLHYPQRPLVESAFSRLYPAGPFLNGGENLIVAVATLGGYNMEDAVLLNQGSVDRGMFNVTVMRSIFGDEESTFDEQRAVQIYVDSQGLPEVNQLLNVGDIAVSRTKFIDERVKLKLDQFEGSTVQHTQKRENADIVVDKDVDKSFVDRVYARPGFCKVRVRKFRLPELGDKVCSRHGQKGVVGALVPTVDMPCNARGLTPDLIINPHAFPSRMTVGHLLECLVAKTAVLNGTPSIDATPFEPRTGEQIDTPIFIGPTYYLRLKHMVQDKINYRARGKLVTLTGQPTQGRGNDGGIRMGEMERDVMISHGTMAFLKESYVDRSDGTRDFLLAESNGDLVGAKPERKLVAANPTRISSVSRMAMVNSGTTGTQAQSPVAGAPVNHPQFGLGGGSGDLMQGGIVNSGAGIAPIYFPSYNGPLLETYFGPDDRYGLHMINGVMRMFASEDNTSSALALSTNSNNIFKDLMYVTHDGNVGIGTTTPLYNLDVDGSAAVNGLLTVNGNVGIGTTEPASLLQIVGGTSPDGLLNITLSNNIGCGCNLASFGTSDSTKILFIDENDPVTLGPAIQFNASNIGQIIGGGNLCLLPAVGGFVGIGMSNPQYTLDVAGTAHVSNLAVDGLLTANENLYFASTSIEHGIYFAGTPGDSGNLSAPYSGILNRLYDPTGGSNVQTDNSELLIFQFNDPGAPNGPDRIRHLAAAHTFQVYKGNSVYPDDTAAFWADNNYNTSMCIANCGYVGIGTTTPAYTLDVNGAVRMNANNNSNTNKLLVLFDGNATDPVSTATNFFGLGINQSTLRYQVPLGEQHTFYNGSAATFTTGETNAFYGNVGIGTTTPSSMLQIIGNNTSPNGILNVTSTNNIGSGCNLASFGTSLSPRFLFLDEDLNVNLGPAIQFNAGNIGQIIGGGNLCLLPNPAVGGCVGIGTTNPQYNLDVNGNARVTGTLNMTSATNPATAPIIYTNGYNGNLLEAYFNSSDRYGLNLDGGVMRMYASSSYDLSALALSLNNNNTFTDLLYVTHGGNVGIGTTTPIYTLDVNGTARVNTNNSENNKLLVLYDSDPADPVSTATNFFGFGINQGTLRYQAPVNNQHQFFVDSNAIFVVNNGGSEFNGNVTLNNGSVLTVTNGNVGGYTPELATAPIYFPAYNGPLIETYFAPNDRYGLHMTNGVMRMFASEAFSTSALALSLNSNNTFTDFLYVTHGGNVGIGTTNPQYTLDVNGTCYVNNLLNVGNVVQIDPSGSSVFDNRLVINNALNVGGGSTLSGGANVTNGSLTVPNGNIGIGTTTPQYNLDVVGTARMYSLDQYVTMNGANIAIQGGGYSAVLINFGINGYGGYNDCVGSTDPRQVIASNSPLPYHINPSGGSVYLQSSNVSIVNGEVGIGTTTPAYTLDVNGNIRATGTLNMTSGSVPDTAPIYFPTYNGPLVETYFGSDDRYGLNMTNAIMRMYASEADTYSALALSLNSNNTFTDFLYVTHGGNVGIGTTNPQYTLDVNGACYVNALNVGGGSTLSGGANVNSGNLTVIGSFGINTMTPEYTMDLLNATMRFEYLGVNVLVMQPNGTGASAGYNTANTILFAGSDNITQRSINASGSVNTLGNDYAEYMTKNSEFTLAKGDIFCRRRYMGKRKHHWNYAS